MQVRVGIHRGGLTMSELNKSKGLSNVAVAPPPVSRTSTPSSAMPPKPLMPGRKNSSSAAAPPATPVRKAAEPPVAPTTPANLAAPTVAPNTADGSVTIHTFDDVDLMNWPAPAAAEPGPPAVSPKPMQPAKRLTESLAPKPKPRSVRACRTALALPMLVRGIVGGQQNFREETRTIFVHARGAALGLATRLSVGQAVTLVNLINGKEAACTVVDVQSGQGNKNLVEVEFQQPVAFFWPVSFPMGEKDERKPTESKNGPGVPQGSLAGAPGSPVEEAEKFAQSKSKKSADAVAASTAQEPAKESLVRVVTPAAVPPGDTIDLATLILTEESVSPRTEPYKKAARPGNVSTPPSRQQAVVLSKAAHVPASFLSEVIADTAKSELWTRPRNNQKWMMVGAAAVLVVIASLAGWAVHRRSSNPTLSTTPVTTTAPSSTPAPNAGAANSQTATVTGAGLVVRADAPETSATKGSSLPGEVGKNSGTGSENKSTPKSKKPSGILTASLAAPLRLTTPKDSPPPPPSINGIPTMPNSNASGAAVLGLGAGSAPRPPVPFPVGGDVRPPRLISSASPTYPAFAKNSHIEGDVVILATIDASGNVTGMKVVSGPDALRQAAQDALHHWKYEPGTLDGQAVATQMQVTLKFRLR